MSWKVRLTANEAGKYIADKYETTFIAAESFSVDLVSDCISLESSMLTDVYD